MAEPDNSNVGLITTVAIGGSFFVVALVMAPEGLYWQHDRASNEIKNVKREYAQRVELKKAQTEKLANVKIDEAMTSVVKEAAATQAK
jgi:hypothetical protein